MYIVYHDTIPSTSGIYRITCSVTGLFYIGSAVNLCQRRYDHFKTLRRNIHRNPKLQNAWNKYGEESFTFEVIELVLIPFLIIQEQYWLDKLKPFGKKGFNIARIAGSSLGQKRSPEACKNMSDAQRGKPSSFKGKKRSPETIEKLRISHRGQTPHNRGKETPLEIREKIRLGRVSSMKTLIVTAPDGTEYLVIGVGKFCKEHGLIRHHLIGCAKGIAKYHKGWTARFPETDVG